MKVFISHSSSDKWIARQIAAHLEQRGIESFLDEKDIETGDPIDETIQAQINDCDELLMILSPAALGSTWVLIEVGGAKALKKRLVPILLHVGPNELPDPLSNGLARDINEIETYYDEVQQRIQADTEIVPTTREQEVASRREARSTKQSFSIGDRVRLPRQMPENTYSRTGRDVGWSPAMDRFLDETAEIIDIDEEMGYAHVDVDDGQWYWLLDWLEPIQESP